MSHPARDALLFEAAATERSFGVWRIIADALPTMVFTRAPGGTLEFVNRRWCQFTGYDPATACSADIGGILHPDDVARVQGTWQRSLAAGVDFASEHRLRKADGSYSWIYATAAPLRDASGEIVRWFGSVIDIDAQKRAEAALRDRELKLSESERKFRALAEAVPVVVWTADAGGWIDWYNQHWYTYTGQTPAEAAGWGWQAAHHPDDFLEVMRRWPHSIATGQPFEMEFRLRRHDGVFHWFLTRVQPLHNEQGEIVRWYGSNVDIDAQKLALQRSVRVAETLQNVFLPRELPQNEDVRFDAVYLAAEKDALVGGDWYDAFDLPDGRIGFSIGDVAGHGLEASVIVGRLRQAIYTLTFRLADPAAVLHELNLLVMHQEAEGTLITALVGCIDARCSEMTYASAGHPPPIVAVRRAESARIMPLGGLPLGVVADLELTAHRVTIEPDMVIGLYTDGMTEYSRDIENAEQRMCDALALIVGDTKIARPAAALQRAVLDEVVPTDDAALLVMQFSRVDRAALQADPALRTKTWRFHSSDAFTARRLRQELIAFISAHASVGEDLFNVELILGEILANTVEHAPGLVEIRIDWSGEKPVMTVLDSGPGLREFAGELPRDELDENGRGMFLIRAFADEVAVRPAPGYGTELRVVLPVVRVPA